MPPYAPQDGSESAARLEFRTGVAVLVAALVITLMPPRYQEAVASALRGTALKPFLALQEELVRARTRAEVAGVLQIRIDSLTGLAMGRTTLEEENRRLRGLLQLRGRLGPEWASVQVLRPGTPDSEGMLLVDAGLVQGVRPRAPLVTREGLGGVIREVSANQAVGMDWTHSDFSASAMTLDGLHYGMVRSDLGILQETRLLFEGLPFSAEVDSGTVVVTSGLGGNIPRGLPIGRVVVEETSEGEWRKNFWLQPFVEAGSITLALVGLEGLRPQEDLSAVWERDDFLRAEERLRVGEQFEGDAALRDTVRILRDSLALLRRGSGPENGGVR
ncbi:MAG: rod shape-determining protein MreC [Gemmatimonadales bacterium]|jgi:rod shape-determining protein MreC|nr:MAG: rod shape-determining protein MreC [Gemmatimonadales bacterium]